MSLLDPIWSICRRAALLTSVGWALLSPASVMAQPLSGPELIASLEKLRTANGVDRQALQAGLTGRSFKVWLRVADSEALDFYAGGEWTYSFEAETLTLQLNTASIDSFEFPLLVGSANGDYEVRRGLYLQHFRGEEGAPDAEKADEGGQPTDLAYLLIQRGPAAEDGIFPTFTVWEFNLSIEPEMARDLTRSGLMLLVEGTVAPAGSLTAQCGVKPQLMRVCALSVDIDRVVFVARARKDEPLFEYGPRTGGPIDRSDMPDFEIVDPFPRKAGAFLEFDKVVESLRAQLSARFPQAWERDEPGADGMTVRLTFEPGDLSSPGNQAIIADVVRRLPFAPALWSLRRIDSTNFDLTVWKSF